MMFRVVGVNAVFGEDYRPISLVGVDGGGANARVSVDAGKDDGIGPEPGKNFVKSGSVKRAVPSLHQDGVGWCDRQFGKDFAAWSAFDGDANALGSHFWKRVSQVGFELLPDPDQGMGQAPHIGG